MQNPIPRVQVRPLIWLLLFALIVPVGVAFVADRALGTTPVIAVAASLVCIPLTTLLVIRRTMSEMDALIAVVAPPDAPETEEESNAADSGGVEWSMESTTTAQQTAQTTRHTSNTD